MVKANQTVVDSMKIEQIEINGCRQYYNPSRIFKFLPCYRPVPQLISAWPFRYYISPFLCKSCNPHLSQLSYLRFMKNT